MGIRRGSIISDLNGYYDCPSIKQFADGRILLTVHRSPDREGSVSDLQLFQTESNDGGEHFQRSFWLTYDGDRIIKNPRGSFVPRRLRDSSFAMVYYNNGGTFRAGYCHRLVYWLTWGREVYGSIVWNEPEIVLYHSGPEIDKNEEGLDFESFGHVDGPGYPDILEHVNGPDLSIVESNKFCLRFHAVDRRVVDGLRRQHIDTYLPDDFVRNMGPGKHRLPNLPEINAGVPSAS